MEDRRGGNGIVKFSGNLARKVLRKNLPHEKRERFIREIEILRTIAVEHGFSNVVEILSFDTEVQTPWYEMRAYAGDSNDILFYTRQSAFKTAKLFIPIIATLKALSESPTPVYHRDLKPENLLHDGRAELTLADFGCAFLQTDEERFTPEFRAVGAMAYRAPEYQYGRVGQVNEKGDIFSLGKLLWYFFNGIRGEIFPYTLWFPTHYDLLSRFPDTEGVAKLNLIIAGAVHHDPDKRISYDELLDGLTDLTTRTAPTEAEMEKIAALAYEQDLALHVEECRTITQNILDLFWNDLGVALSSLKQDFPDFGVVEKLFQDFRSATIEERSHWPLESVIEEEWNCPVWDHRQPSFMVYTRIFPAKQWNIAFPHPEGPTAYPFINMTIECSNRSNVSISPVLCWYFEDDKGPMQVHELKKITHQTDLLYSVLRDALRHLVS